MPTLRSHTHLQATQSQAQTKACKRVCLPNNTTDTPTYDRKEQRRHNIKTNKQKHIYHLIIKADTSVLLSIRCSAIPVFVGGLI
ncbi:MAG: hypothetical protein LCH44_14190 [Bacteroidetes bacterium]|jgi:hypothetical protein|nr:hypothetical protein [Bacteroidota bacterium]